MVGAPCSSACTLHNINTITVKIIFFILVYLYQANPTSLRVQETSPATVRQGDMQCIYKVCCMYLHIGLVDLQKIHKLVAQFVSEYLTLINSFSNSAK